MDVRLRPLFAKTAARVSRAEAMPIGAPLFAELEALSSAPIDAETAVRLHALWGKVISHSQARQMMASQDTVNAVRDSLVQPKTLDDAEMLAAQELACATQIPYSTARNHLSLVRRVGESLHLSWSALDRGDIELSHLKAVEHATEHCTAELAEAVDAEVIPLTIQRRWTPSEAGKAARRLMLALDPEGSAERAQIAREAADVRFYPELDETATVSATGEASVARRVYDRITADAEAMARNGDDRSAGVRRFHALANAVLGTSDSRDGSVAAGEVLAHVELPTVLGVNDHPGELVGYGPICADSARRLAADNRLRRIVTDPLSGAVVDMGRRAYAPSKRLRKAVQAVHPTCTAPGCCRPAVQCEVDHRKEYDAGGRTDQANLKPLCKLHHELKTRKLWKVDDNGDGTDTWTSYLGLTYVKDSRSFPLPEPPPIEDEPPADVADRLPHAFDPDPPSADDPLPEPPSLTDEQYKEMERALTVLGAMDLSFRQWCDTHYDEARATGLVA
jgi:hypothetical protein